MTSSGAGDIAWLGSGQEAIAFHNEKLEYGLRGPLIAASVVFESEISVHAWMSKARARVKLPLLWNGAVELASAGLNVSRGPVAFETYSENLLEGRKRNDWSSADGKLTCVWQDSGESHSVEWSEVELAKLPARVLDPLSLQQALADSYLPGRKLFGAITVFGKNLLALRIELNESSTAGMAKAFKIGRAFDSASFQRIPWQQKDGVEFQWDPERARISQFSYRHKLIGPLRLPLTQFERA